jgi:hypothetical protein
MAGAAVLASAFFVLIGAMPAQATQGIPYEVNFQGRLTDNNGNILADGFYNMKFRIADDPTLSGGHILWTEDREVIAGPTDLRVHVVNGLFSVQLGDVTALSPTIFNSSSLRYLEIELPSTATNTCSSVGCASWTEGPFSPRHIIGASPYSFVADTLDGLDSTAFGQVTAANTFTGANLFAPTAGSTVALTVKATTAGSTNSLEVFDSGGARQAYFDASGNFNVARTIQATSNNAIDLGTSGTAFRTGYFGTSVVSPAVNATTTGGTIATNAGTLQRIASGTFTVDLKDSSNTALAVVNSGTGVANFTVDGNITDSGLTTDGAVYVTSGVLNSEANLAVSRGGTGAGTSQAAINALSQLTTNGDLEYYNGTNTTRFSRGANGDCLKTNTTSIAWGSCGIGAESLQGAYNGGATISTSGSDIGFTLNSSDKFTTTTAAGATGYTKFVLANGTNTSPPAQLVLIDNADTNEAPTTGLKVTSSGGGTITTALDASGSGITNALAIGANAISGSNFSVTGAGAVTAVGVNAGSGLIQGTGGLTITGTTSLTGAVTNTLSATSGSGATLAVTDSASSGATTIKGLAINLTGTNNASGSNALTGLDFGVPAAHTNNTYTGVNFGTGFTNDLTYNGATVLINGSGQINGAQLQSTSVANGALANSTIGVTAGTGLTGGSASISLGGSTSLSIDQTAALTWTALEQFNKSGGVGVQLNGSAASGGAQLLFGSVTGLNSGSANGTYIGANAASYTGDFINFAIGSVNKLKVDNAGAITAAGTITGSSLATSGNGTINSGSGTISSTGAINGGTLSATTSVTSPSYTGTGAVTLSSGGAAGLTLDSASNTLSIAANDTTLQRTASGTYSIDLNDSANTTLAVGNSGTGVANLTVDGTINGATLSSTAVGGVTFSNIALLNAANTFTGNNNNTFTGEVTIQPTTNIPSAVVKQNSSGSFGQDVFDVSGSSSGNFIQVTSTAANQGAVTVQSLGANALTLQSGSGTVTLGSTTALTATGALTVESSGSNGVTLATQVSGQNVNLSPNGTGTVVIGGTTPTLTSAGGITLQAGSTAQNVNITPSTSGSVVIGGTAPTITTSGATALVVNPGGAASLSLGTANANAVSIGNTGSTVAIQGNATAGGAVTITAVTNGGILATTTGTGTVEFDTAASVIAQSTTNSATAFQVQNAASVPVLNVDTTGANANNLITTITASGASSFEGATTTGWTGDGASPCTPAAVTSATTPPSSGAYSGQCATTGTAGQGYKYVTGLTGLPVSGTYTLNFYAKASATPGNFLSFGYVQNGGGEDVAGLSMTTQYLSTSGWTRYSLTFKTGATNGAADYIYIKQTDATTRNLWLDAVTLQTDANNDTNYREAKLQVAGVISSPLVVQNASNSTNAFTVQNSSGSNIFNIDTTDTNLVANHGFEANSSGWAIKGSSTVLQRDTTKSYLGIASGKVTTTSTSGDGARYTFASQLPANTYTISAYVQASVADSTFNLGYNNGADVNCASITPAASATVPSTAGWTRFTCTTATSAVLNSIYITSGTTAVTLNIDAVQVEAGSTATAYGAGGISLNGVLNSPTTIKNSANSTTAFQVQNAAGDPLIGVDTLNSLINIGETGSVATASTVNIATSTGAVQTTNIGSTNSTSTTNILGGTSGTINIGTVGSTANASTVHLSDTSGNATQIVSIGSNGNTSSTIDIDAGTGAAAIEIGDTSTAHGIKIGAGGAAAGNAQTIVIGSGSTTTGSTVTITAGNSTTTSGTAGVFIGSPTTDANQVNLQLDSFSTFAEAGSTCSTTVNQGALYYNTNSNAIRSCVNGGWEDVVTTAGLGIMVYGVVPDSGSNPGDLISVVTAGTTGPCKVSWKQNASVGNSAQVNVAPCTAYTGGRKVVIANTTVVTLDGTVANQWEHLCFNTTGGLPTTLAAGTSTEANTNNLPAFSANNPVVCLADIQMGAGTGTSATIAAVFDVRAFTTSIKEFATASTALGLGWIACPNVKQVTTCGTTQGTAIMEGVVVATNGATSATNPNVILAVSGPTMAKPTLTLNVGGDLVQNSGTINRVTATGTTAGTAVYGNLGVARSASPGTACTATASAANCDYQMYFNQARR